MAHRSRSSSKNRSALGADPSGVPPGREPEDDGWDALPPTFLALADAPFPIRAWKARPAPRHGHSGISSSVIRRRSTGEPIRATVVTSPAAPSSGEWFGLARAVASSVDRIAGSLERIASSPGTRPQRARGARAGASPSSSESRVGGAAADIVATDLDRAAARAAARKLGFIVRDTEKKS